MSLYPCSACSERVPGKLSQVYWAWIRADGVRVAYKQRLCLKCFSVTLLGLIPSALENLVTCPACGISTVDDMDPVYATCYVPGQPQLDLELALCGAHAVEIRNRALAGAETLADRQGALGGSSPPPQLPTDAWAALGILPKDIPPVPNYVVELK